MSRIGGVVAPNMPYHLVQQGQRLNKSVPVLPGLPSSSTWEIAPIISE